VGSEGDRLARSCGSNDRRIHNRLVTAREDSAAIGLDRPPCSGVVAIHVLRASGIVLDHDRSDYHGERSIGVLGGSFRPLDGSGSVCWITATPRSYFKLHWALGILVIGIRGLECSDSLSVDLPDNLVGSPVDGVLFEACLTPNIIVERTTVVISCFALTKVI
jgi:hypothetical protein